MNREGIEQILAGIGAEKVRPRDTYVDSACPFAVLHEKKADTRPSFGVKIAPGKRSIWKCFACGTRGSGMMRFLFRWSEVNKRQIPEGLVALAATEADLDTVLDDLLPDKPGEPDILPESMLDPFRGKVPKYLLDRGITLETAKVWELGFDRRNRRLIFPIRDRDWRLLSLSGRLVYNDPVKSKYWNLGGTKKDFFYGEWLRVGGRPIILVEGFFDVLWTWQNRLGEYDVLGVMGAQLTKAQADKLIAWGEPVYLFLDHDWAGLSGMLDAVERLVLLNPNLYVAEWVRGLGLEPTEYLRYELIQSIARAMPSYEFESRYEELDRRRKLSLDK